MANEIVQVDALKAVDLKKAVAVILAGSVLVLAALMFVIFGHGRAQAIPEWVGLLPALNALLNGTSAVLLVLAYRAVRARNLAGHARLMLAALGASALFLVSYVVYHSLHGDT